LANKGKTKLESDGYGCRRVGVSQQAYRRVAELL